MIDQVTQALSTHIQNRTPDLGAWVVIHSLSAAEDAPRAQKLVLALIAVDEHDHLRNAPLVQSQDGYRRPPMHLRLHYLITYIGKHEEAQARLARVLAVFHTTPVLRAGDLPSSITDHVDTLTVRLENTTADERNHVWTSLGREGRLALFYTVDVAPIDLLETPDGWGRVEQHRVDYVGAP